jgi:hypothetical protein
MLNISHFLHRNFAIENSMSLTNTTESLSIEIRVSELIKRHVTAFENMVLDEQEYFELTNEIEEFAFDIEQCTHSENMKMIIFALASFIYDHTPLFNAKNSYLERGEDKVNIELMAVSYFKKTPLINNKTPIEAENLDELIISFRKCILDIVENKYSTNQLKTIYVAGCYLDIYDSYFRFSLPIDDTHTQRIIDDSPSFEIMNESHIVQRQEEISEAISKRKGFRLEARYLLLILVILILSGGIYE